MDSKMLYATSETIEVRAKNWNEKEKEEEGINSSFVELDDDDSASEKPQIDEAIMLALVSAVKKYNPFNADADADLGPGQTPDGIATTRFNKRPREGTIVAEELENDVAEINAKIRGQNKAFVLRIVRNAMKHIIPFLAENGVQMRIKNDSGEGGVEINADEEAFATSIARMVMEGLTPLLAERRRRRRRVI
ncbi:hypothetical protein TSUD_389060 [Trifolium subterraneum]|uniref:Uncharacterized protein n=1 Tax=Trifolium subterraneum TaxID=3900 RepID=A0A2Z6MF98_TRISU|nr:hypothetical protein TSUD_389060 [Trifolium subterraneum]